MPGQWSASGITAPLTRAMNNGSVLSSVGASGGVNAQVHCAYIFARPFGFCEV